MKYALFGGSAFVLIFICSMVYASQVQDIELEVGASFVIRHPSIQRIAVGNSQVVQASALSPSEGILFGKRSGITTVTAWISETAHIVYRVQVRPEGHSRVLKDAMAILSAIPGARATLVSGRLIIEGVDLSDKEQATITRLVARFPELLEFTNHSDWDRMVMLDVQVIEIPTARMRELGVRWDTNASLGMQSTRFALTALVSARLAALSKAGEAIVLAQPQLLARSGSTASFSAGGEVPYTTQDKDGKAHTTFKKYGVHLNITPHVGKNLGVRSKIEIEVSTVDQSLASAAGPALKVRRASTDFNVRSGQTLVLGGFISRERSQETEGLPGLSEVPVLGHLFGVNRAHRTQTELAIFVTPIVVDATNADLAQRTSNARALLDSNFPEAVRLNNAVNAEVKEKASDIFDSQWDSSLSEISTPPFLDQWE
jgi:pilus assembly protein CpaC